MLSMMWYTLVPTSVRLLTNILPKSAKDALVMVLTVLTTTLHVPSIIAFRSKVIALAIDLANVWGDNTFKYHVYSTHNSNDNNSLTRLHLADNSDVVLCFLDVY